MCDEHSDSVIPPTDVGRVDRVFPVVERQSGKVSSIRRDAVELFGLAERVGTVLRGTKTRGVLTRVGVRVLDETRQGFHAASCQGFFDH